MTATPRTILRMPEVEKACGYKRSSIYKMIQEGTFPRPKKLGPQAVGWSSDDINRWIDEKLGVDDEA